MVAVPINAAVSPTQMEGFTEETVTKSVQFPKTTEMGQHPPAGHAPIVVTNVYSPIDRMVNIPFASTDAPVVLAVIG